MILAKIDTITIKKSIPRNSQLLKNIGRPKISPDRKFQLRKKYLYPKKSPHRIFDTPQNCLLEKNTEL